VQYDEAKRLLVKNSAATSKLQSAINGLSCLPPAVKDRVIELPLAMLQPGNNIDDASIVQAARELGSSALNPRGKVVIISRPTVEEGIKKLKQAI
jgi:hypothetical protein